jgi:hypothetical protein
VDAMRRRGLTQRISSYSAAFNPKLIQHLGATAEGVACRQDQPVCIKS